MALDILGKLDELGVPYEEAEVEVINGVEYRGYTIATNLTPSQVKAFYEYVSSDEETTKEYNAWIEKHPIKASKDLFVEWTEEEIEAHQKSQAEANRMAINVTVKGEDSGEA